MSCPKLASEHRCVMIDLNHHQDQSVNTDTNLDTPSILTLPTIDNITDKIKQLGKGSLIIKLYIARAFRYVKMDPVDYPKLGLKFYECLLLTYMSFIYT